MFCTTNGVKQICTCGFHIFPIVSCEHRTGYPQHRSCSLCSLLILLLEYLTLEVKNKAGAASLICASFGETVSFAMQNSVHKCCLKDPFRDLHCVLKCHWGKGLEGKLVHRELLQGENIPLCLFFLSLHFRHPALQTSRASNLNCTKPIKRNKLCLNCLCLSND